MVLGRRIALKLLNERAASPLSVARFSREAQAIARLSHPNVVAIHDAGDFDNRRFLAMESVEGQTMADWLGAGPRSWREIRQVFMAAGAGLAAAHQAGLVHRDFKPQNVMVGNDGAVRVMDFGLATDASEIEPGDAAAFEVSPAAGARPPASPKGARPFVPAEAPAQPADQRAPSGPQAASRARARAGAPR